LNTHQGRIGSRSILRSVAILFSLSLSTGCAQNNPVAENDLLPAVTTNQIATLEDTEQPLEIATDSFAPSLTPSIEQLLYNLQNGEPSVRADAAWELWGSSDPRIVEPLQIAMKDEYADVRMHAITTLEDIDDPRILPAMIESLPDPDQEVRFEAANGLSMHTDIDTARSYIAELQLEDSALISFRIDWYFKRAQLGTEAVLIELLFKLSNKQNQEELYKFGCTLQAKDLAEMLLNSGNNTLGASAINWARAAGYTMVPS